MDDNTLNNTNMTTGPMTPRPKKSNTGKVVLLILLVLIVAAGAVAGGWFIGNAQKNQAIEDAKRTAKEEAQKEADTHKAPSAAPQEKHQAKTATETTCNADELSLAVDPNADGAAGTLTYHLTLKNIGKRTCILGGFPGVSLVNDNGNMIGSPAERATNYEEKKLTLAPNTEVMAMVSVSNSTNFSDEQCKEGATKFRVYPPNDTGYLSASSGDVDSWCPGFLTSPVLAM